MADRNTRMSNKESVLELIQAKPWLYPIVVDLLNAMLEFPDKPLEEIENDIRQKYGL